MVVELGHKQNTFNVSLMSAELVSLIIVFKEVDLV